MINGKMEITAITNNSDGSSSVEFFIDDDLYAQMSKLAKERNQTVEDLILSAIDYHILTQKQLIGDE